MDEQVWHNPDDVAQGIDAVVQAAMDWIDSLTTVGLNEPSIVLLKNGIKSYPNPFSNQTTIELTLHNAGQVNIGISDITGKIVVTLVSGYKQEGIHKINWNAEGLPAGIYFLRLQTNGVSESRKLLLLK